MTFKEGSALSCYRKKFQNILEGYQALTETLALGRMWAWELLSKKGGHGLLAAEEGWRMWTLGLMSKNGRRGRGSCWVRMEDVDLGAAE